MSCDGLATKGKKSYEYIFLRNADDAKAYRLYDVNKRKIVISRDAIFLEREDLVIDTNNFNNNSHIYVHDDDRFEEISETYQITTENHTPIAPGEDDNEIEPTGDFSVTVDEIIDNSNETLNNSNDESFESMDETSIEKQEKIRTILQILNIIIYYCARENITNYPNFHTRARVDMNAERPVTRSLRNLLMHMAFSVFNEPDSYSEAITSDDADKWKTAMREESDSLIKNNTWILIVHNGIGIYRCFTVREGINLVEKFVM